MSTAPEFVIEGNAAALIERSQERERLSRILEQQSQPESDEWKSNPNVYNTGPCGWEGFANRIIILEDQFRSGYECDRCEETGKLACEECDNGHSRVNAEIICKSCGGTLQVSCPDCNGKGALLVLSEESKRRPTTGRIVSIGDKVESLKVGDTVLYSNYVGEVYDLTGIDSVGRERMIVLRQMKEFEIIAKLHGHLALRRVKRHEFQGGG